MNILDVGKEIVEFIKKAGEKQLLDFLLELRETILKLRAENQALRKKVGRQDNEPAAGKVVQCGKFIYSTNDPMHQRPFCLACWAFDQKLSPLMLIDDETGMQARCKTCEDRK